MAFLEKNEGNEYDSYVYTTELAGNHEMICSFIQLLLSVERFSLREVVAFSSEKRYRVSKKDTPQERWTTILLGKLGSGKIRAVVVDGQYDGNDCEIGIGVKTGHVCITMKKGETFDFQSFVLALGLIEPEEGKEVKKRRRGRKTAEDPD